VSQGQRSPDDADGSHLSWDNIVADLPKSYQCIAQQHDAKWTFISQTEHPHLNNPWYMLHPCQTAELLQLMLESEDNATTARASQHHSSLRYMTAWFSLVGPVIRLQFTALVH